MCSPCRHWSLCSHVSKHIQDICSGSDLDDCTCCDVRPCVPYDLQPLSPFLRAITFQQHAPVHLENHDHDHRRDGIWRHFSPGLWGIRQWYSTNTISKSIVHTVGNLSYSHAHPLHQLASKNVARYIAIMDIIYYNTCTHAWMHNSRL